MRRLWNIIWRVLVALLLLIYVAVAAVNYSVVQSYIGAAAGMHFSREWGATVRIGSIEVTPWDHLSAHNILLVSPDDDTIFDAATLKLKFHHFPYKKGNIKEGGLNVGTLELQRLYLANAYYHFASISCGDTCTLTLILSTLKPDCSSVLRVTMRAVTSSLTTWTSLMRAHMSKNSMCGICTP